MAIKNFTVQDAMSMYGVKEWGYGFFGVNSKGHLVVHPTRDENLSCDVFDIVQHLRKKGVATPLILRFPQILAARVTELNEAFHKAMREYDYAGSYQGVYP
ncbi:MAG: arginine decarboxylase, partial [Holophaga sp.]|nr:arginine decarboxylase [Holophaga sp.]